ncbi:hypothetical protein SAMN05216275_103442 [Streptosporangium canum]|uniref:DUF4276 domain-containing protein n=1 Tax=Streptosporangium canum TaxID=324952 RepID=A0A1I3IWX3_9ACTN|nr:hypothetical protein [Streptosporangium canum]SFI52348.1 hypothetical protein SAMN05216275_103442 [Streptosporangium canum]
MSRRGGTRVRPTRKPIVVVAGEDRNDRLSLRILLEDLCPDMRGRIVEISDPVRLRQATGANLAARAETLARKVRARAVRDDTTVACVFVHEDLDAVDDDRYPIVRLQVEKALETALGRAHYALAVAEIESWLLLFPDALTAFCGSWSVPARHRGRDTGKLADPKQVLMKEVSGSSRRYRETDAPDVLDRVVTLGLTAAPLGRNRSYERLREDAARCCAEHLRERSQ